MIRVMIIATFFMLSFTLACVAEDDKQDEGLFSKGSFLSDAINSVTHKFDTVSSGEEKIVSNDAKGIPQNTLEYDGNPLSRPLPKPSFRNKRL